ncbi:hypothetical protein V6N12_054557 [Hibiscus sabdariffa]|uniref:RNase H type-1 domain-containing protein n=1 Tax=Hibiscus sabdariffa TaxID=183260 RepID=A0ABR2D2K6_9ROSI
MRITRSNERNLTFMQKLAFTLICCLDAFWVQTLRQKYQMRGNGANVHILDDTWVPSLRPLRQWLCIPNHVVDNLKFNDLLLHNGQWDVDQLRELLHHDAISHIIELLPPALDNSHDKWRDGFVFNEICLPLTKAYEINIVWAAYFAETCATTQASSTPRIVYHQWKQSAHGWLCLNADEAISPVDGTRTIGGVPATPQGPGYGTIANVAWSFGTDRLVIQSDNSHAIKLVLDPSALRHSMQLVHVIATLRLKS